MFLLFHFSFFMKGVVKMKKDLSGFGFITPIVAEGQKATDVFFHFSKVEGGDPAFKSLEVGQEVDFEVEQGNKGPQAKTVRPLGGDYDMAA